MLAEGLTARTQQVVGEHCEYLKELVTFFPPGSMHP